MKSRNPSLLSNSAPPRLADALPNRPNRISSQPPSWGREAATRRHGHLFAAALGAHLASKIFHGGLEAAASVRDAQRAEGHLDRTEHAEHHRCIDVAHVRDPERAALQITNPAAEYDAALLTTIVAERARLAALHEHCGHRVRALLGADDVERDRVRLRPPAHGVARRLREQRVAADRRVEAFLEEHIERLAQAEEQVLRRRASVLLVMRFAAAERTVPVACAEVRVLMCGVRALVR